MSSSCSFCVLGPRVELCVLKADLGVDLHGRENVSVLLDDLESG